MDLVEFPSTEAEFRTGSLTKTSAARISLG